MCVCFSHYSGHVIRPQYEWNSWTFSTSACSSSPFLVLLPSVSLLYFQSPTEKSPTPLCCCSISPAKFTPRISLPLHFLILLLDSYEQWKKSHKSSTSNPQEMSPKFSLSALCFVHQLYLLGPPQTHTIENIHYTPLLVLNRQLASYFSKTEVITWTLSCHPLRKLTSIPQGHVHFLTVRQERGLSSCMKLIPPLIIWIPSSTFSSEI